MFYSTRARRLLNKIGIEQSSIQADPRNRAQLTIPTKSAHLKGDLHQLVTLQPIDNSHSGHVITA